MITDVVTTMDELERFAALAYAAGQAAEIAKMPPAPLVVDTSYIDSEALADAIKSMKSAMPVLFARTPRLDEIAAAVAAEREACVQVIKDIAVYGKVFQRIGKIRTPAMNALHLAIDFIRARGQQ